MTVTTFDANPGRGAWIAVSHRTAMADSLVGSSDALKMVSGPVSEQARTAASNQRSKMQHPESKIRVPLDLPPSFP
jgi:hypothetical protein